MKTKRVQFKNKDGHTLSARLELPLDSHPHNCAIFAHCFTCNKNLTAIRNISQALTAQGIAVLRFDFTGLGESEGDFADTNFSSNVEDLVAAAQYLEQEIEAPSILIGHSLGGAAVLVAKHHLPSVKAVATIGAPYEPEHVSHLLQGSLEEIEQAGEATVQLSGRPFTIKKQFIEDIRSISSQSLIQKLQAALLVMHSPQDEIVGIENATQIYKAARQPRSFVSLDGADHLMTRKADSQYVGSMIATWAQRYIELPQAQELDSDHPVVVRTGEEGYTTDVKAGRHRLTADEPESVGGNDFGPTPYDFLSIALGTCTSMTLRMYADRKGWDLKEVKVHLQHNKIHAQDCEHCETQEGKIDQIERNLELEGNLDADQRKRLLEIADKCPVHRTLHSEVNIVTKLKESS